MELLNFKKKIKEIKLIFFIYNKFIIDNSFSIKIYKVVIYILLGKNFKRIEKILIIKFLLRKIFFILSIF
jgi:hypothetical protein